MPTHISLFTAVGYSESFLNRMTVFKSLLIEMTHSLFRVLVNAVSSAIPSPFLILVSWSGSVGTTLHWIGMSLCRGNSWCSLTGYNLNWYPSVGGGFRGPRGAGLEMALRGNIILASTLSIPASAGMAYCKWACLPSKNPFPKRRWPPSWVTRNLTSGKVTVSPFSSGMKTERLIIPSEGTTCPVWDLKVIRVGSRGSSHPNLLMSSWRLSFEMTLRKQPVSTRTSSAGSLECKESLKWGRRVGKYSRKTAHFAGSNFVKDSALWKFTQDNWSASMVFCIFNDWMSFTISTPESSLSSDSESESFRMSKVLSSCIVGE